MRNRSSSGFTLIELMIVVAIISILAAIAIPSYVKMASKSRQTEAKEGLNGIFSLEKSYFSEKNHYGNIAEIGFVADGAGRYTFCVGDPSLAGSCAEAAVDPVGVGAGNGGVDGSGGGDCGSGGGAIGPANSDCTGGGGSALQGLRPVSGSDDTTTPPPPSTGSSGAIAGNPHADGTTFEADAYGHISNAPAPNDVDVWMLDQRRQLLNLIRGY